MARKIEVVLENTTPEEYAAVVATISHLIDAMPESFEYQIVTDDEISEQL